MKLYVAACVTLLASGGVARAQACDPVAILQQDVSSTTLSGETALIYAKQTAESRSEGTSSGGNVGFAIDGLPVNVGFQTASAVASHVEARLNIDYKNKQYAHHLRRTLSSTALAAYKACLDEQKIGIYTPEEAFKGEEFFADLRWKGGPLSLKGAKMTVRAVNGKLGDKATDIVTLPIRSESVIPVRISGRDVTKPTTISAQVAAEGSTDAAQEIVPPHRPIELAINIVKSATVKRRAPRYTPRESAVCVEAKDGVLIPETATWVILGRTAGTSEWINKGATTKQVCGTLRARGSDFGEASITGQLSVHEVTAKAIAPADAKILAVD